VPSTTTKDSKRFGLVLSDCELFSQSANTGKVVGLDRGGTQPVYRVPSLRDCPCGQIESSL